MMSGGDPITAIITGIIGALTSGIGMASGNPMGGLMGMLGPATMGLTSGLGAAAPVASGASGLMGEAIPAIPGNIANAASGNALGSIGQAAAPAMSLSGGQGLAGIGSSMAPAAGGMGGELFKKSMSPVGMDALQSMSPSAGIVPNPGTPNIAGMTSASPNYGQSAASSISNIAPPNASITKNPSFMSKLFGGGNQNPAGLTQAMNAAGQDPMTRMMVGMQYMKQQQQQQQMKQQMLMGGLQGLAGMGSELLADKPWHPHEPNYDYDKERSRGVKRERSAELNSQPPTASELISRIRSRR